MLSHSRCDSPNHIECADEIDVDHRRPIGVVHLRNGVVAGDTGIIDEEYRRLRKFLQCRSYDITVCDIDMHEPMQKILEAIRLPDIEDMYLCAGFTERLGNRAPDAPTSAVTMAQ